MADHLTKGKTWREIDDFAETSSWETSVACGPPDVWTERDGIETVSA